MRGPLAWRFAGAIILFSTVIAFAITVAEVLLEYRRDLGELDRRMQDIRQGYVASIVENLWVMDEERLHTQIESIVRLPDYVYAEIRVKDKTLLRSGRELDGPGVTEVFPLQYRFRGEMQQIGELRVSASYHGAQQRILNRLVFFLAANATKTLIVAVFIFIIFYLRVGRHIERVAFYARESATDEAQPPLILRREEPAKGDELSELVHEINQLRERLVDMSRAQRERVDTLQKQTALLQQELVARKHIQAELHLMAQVFERSGEAIMLTDGNNNIVAVNDSFIHLTGYTREDVIGQNPRMLSAGTTDPAVYRQMWEGLKTRGAWEGQLWDRNKSGHAYLKWLSITVVRDLDDRIINYIGIFSDVTERNRTLMPDMPEI